MQFFILTRYTYNCYRISMSYDVLLGKKRTEKNANFEHPTFRGLLAQADGESAGRAGGVSDSPNLHLNV